VPRCKEIDVNVFGVCRATKVFALLINESGGRIVNISPISVIVIPNEREAGWTIRKIIDEMAELNADQEYSCSDEELMQSTGVRRNGQARKE
jgi:NAD(P)-dependent dehydrogenase (short-subunit alcohol dehydrogenase family)